MLKCSTGGKLYFLQAARGRKYKKGSEPLSYSSTGNRMTSLGQLKSTCIGIKTVYIKADIDYV